MGEPQIKPWLLPIYDTQLNSIPDEEADEPTCYKLVSTRYDHEYDRWIYAVQYVGNGNGHTKNEILRLRREKKYLVPDPDRMWTLKLHK